MTDQLKRLHADLGNYRRTLDWVISLPQPSPDECRNCCFQLLRDLSKIHSSALDVLEMLYRYEVPNARAKGEFVRSDIQREAELRTRLRDRLRSWTCWESLVAERSWASVAGLASIEDFVECLSLHLPEIHEETLRIERYLELLSVKPTGRSVAGLTTALDHVVFHHLCFVFPALPFKPDIGALGVEPSGPIR